MAPHERSWGRRGWKRGGLQHRRHCLRAEIHGVRRKSLPVSACFHPRTYDLADVNYVTQKVLWDRYSRDEALLDQEIAQVKWSIGCPSKRASRVSRLIPLFALDARHLLAKRRERREACPVRCSLAECKGRCWRVERCCGQGRGCKRYDRIVRDRRGGRWR